MNRRDWLAGAGALAAQGVQPQARGQAGPGLIAHWKLTGDCRDAAGRHHGVDHGVAFVEGPGGAIKVAARFDGVESFIEVADAASLKFADGQFSIAAWVKLDSDVTTVIGDILSKYDPRIRKGLNLSVGSSSPGYSSVGDAKNLYFGIDNGVNGPWLDCGRPWKSNPLISTLIAYRGQLYTGIADASRPQDACRMFRYAGGTEWEDCGRLGKDLLTLSVCSVIVHKGRLYAGTGVWDWVKALKGIAGPNHVYCYEGAKEWRDCGQFGAGRRVLSLASFKGDLYAGDDTGKCFRYDGGTRWSFCGQLENEIRLDTMMAFRGHLYAGTHGSMYRYDGDTRWTCIGRKPFGTTQVHTLQVYDSHLHAGTWPFGKVLRYEGGETWTDSGQLGIATDKHQINEVNDLCVYNGKLYAGVIPLAEVYRHEHGTSWSLLRRMVGNPNYSPADTYSWCRVPSFAVFQGKLFMGTSTCHGRYDPANPPEAGRVHAMEAGKNVSYDDDLGGRWRHVAAIRTHDRLQLYVDGKLQASSAPFDGADFEIANDRPLRIGLGSQNHFSGALADVRIYAGALEASHVMGLHRMAG